MISFRKPLTWLVFGALFVACLIFAERNFTKAFPVVRLRVSMSRDQAVAQASALAEQFHWGPAHSRHAAAFDLDDRLQNYVELEGGGKTVFANLLQGNLISPYCWKVRFFKEREVNETEVRFTPTGRFYGFDERISESAPGANLDTNAARKIAEQTAIGLGGLDLSPYELVESAREVRPSGRVDHFFTYERTRETIGEGRYRLRLTVSGDKLTGWMNFVRIPEAFDRRYEQMRSANETIAHVDTAVIYLVYFGGGCVVGLFFLLKRRYVLWKKALFFGCMIASLQILGELNSLPLEWMRYKTSESSSVFINTILSGLLIHGVIWAMILSMTFIAAETLTRKAFPDFVQFWQSWRSGVANSPTVAGQTVGGYLFVGILVAYDVAVYVAGNRFWGWWTPSDNMINPNIVGMYLPWLTPFANAFQAGFWEECLFRAVPLSCAALIGRRFEQRNLFIGVALVLQALVFGAAHASYPQQPAYARIVEIAPAFVVFGLIYLRFGLLPAVIAHFSIDMVYMSMPLFFTDIPYIGISRVLAVALLLIPAWVVLVRSKTGRSWGNVSEEFLNGTWRPTERLAGTEATDRLNAPVRSLTQREVRWAFVLGATGVMVWFLCNSFTSFAARLEMSRNRARVEASKTFDQKGWTAPPGEWRLTTQVADEQGQPERYVWQVGGPATYRLLQQKGHLKKPSWWVKRVTFSKRMDVAQRAEFFGVNISDHGTVERVLHVLPENRSGKTYSQDEAREVARQCLQTQFHENPNHWKEVEAVPTKRPHRTDWNFTFADTQFASLPGDDVRIRVSIADGQVVDAVRHVHVPEEWARQEEGRLARLGIIQGLCTGGIRILFLVGLVVGIFRWTQGGFSVRIFMEVLLLNLACLITAFVLQWPDMVAGFSTAAPFSNQILQAVGSVFMKVLIVAPIVAIMAGAAVGQHRVVTPHEESKGGIVAISGGLCLVGAIALMDRMAPQWAPFWPEYSDANAFLPPLNILVSEISLFITRASFMLFALSMFNRWANRGTGMRWLAMLGMIVLGILLAGRHEFTSIALWLGKGVVTGLGIVTLNALLFRFRIGFVPTACAAVMILPLLKEISFHAYPGAVMGYSLAILALIVLARRFFYIFCVKYS